MFKIKNRMASQVPLYDLEHAQLSTQRGLTETAEKNNHSSINKPTNVIFRTAIEKTSNLGKRTCNEYKTIFEDVKYKVNYKKSSASNSMLNLTNNRNTMKKEENSKIRSVFSGKSNDRFLRK